MRTILAEVEHRLAAGDRVVMVSRQAPRLADLLGEGRPRRSRPSKTS